MREVAERRSERRRTVFLRAKVYGASEGQEIECAIQDASRSGCKVICRATARDSSAPALTIVPRAAGVARPGGGNRMVAAGSRTISVKDGRS